LSDYAGKETDRRYLFKQDGKMEVKQGTEKIATKKMRQMVRKTDDSSGNRSL
jgi:hypothetical protein